MRIDIDEKSGFCTGVIRAVRKAEEFLEKDSELKSLGELVHNNAEVERLAFIGLLPITYENFENLKDSTALIRAHGEPPETYSNAKLQNIKLIDATCPIVKRLQDKIKATYETIRDNEGSILIFGKENHPEVRALRGQTNNTAHVVRTEDDLETLKLKAPVYLFSQTTMKTDEFLGFAEKLHAKLQSKGIDAEQNLHVNNTICGQVSSREPHLRQFVKAYDLVLFVSGKKSSNGRALYETCKEVNPNTWFIAETQETDEIDLHGVNSIGICGATSTPYWQMEGVKDYLLSRLKEEKA